MRRGPSGEGWPPFWRFTMPEIMFPFQGKHRGYPTSKQPQATAYDLKNVRPRHDGRLRGGKRPALDKWGAGVQIGSSTQPVVALCSVASVS